MTVRAHPLTWPAGFPRTQRPKQSQFGNTSIARASQGILRQLGLMHVSSDDVVISTNVELRLDGLPRSDRRPPEDRGVAVYWTRRGKHYALACDLWDRVEHNLHAIQKHIEALRGIDRWGCGSLDQAFAGYAALPSGERPHWTEVLGIDRSASADEIKRRWRHLSKLNHPDHNGDAERFKAIQQAWEDYRAEVVA